MTIEQRDQERGARFRLACDKASALLERQFGSHKEGYNSSGEMIPAAG